MRITVIGATAVATELAVAAATVSGRVKSAAAELAHGIEQEWENGAPVGPTGRTSSDPANYVELIDDAGRVGAAAVNNHFVSRFLQTGTSKMSPKYDFIGAADPYLQQWPDRIAEAGSL